MNRSTLLPALIVGSLGLSVLAACTDSGEAATTSEASSTSTTTTSTTTTTTPPTTTEPAEVIRHPLTGVVVAAATDIPGRPALAVKIDNHPRARPQAGLNEADIVFEENVESLTRFAAVFHTNDADPVGPIRSGRSQDVGILTPIGNPLFAWSGGNGGVRQLIRSSELVDLDAGFTDGYYRRTGRGGAPHNLYSSTAALWANTPETFTTPRPIFPFLEPGVDPAGAPALDIAVPMDGVRVRWVYDPESGRYLRFQNNSAHETEQSGQVSAENVVVMGVEYARSSADPKSPEAQTTGSGPLFVFSGGVVRQGVWVRESISDPFSFLLAPESDPDDPDQVIGLVPGRTWVEVARLSDAIVTWS